MLKTYFDLTKFGIVVFVMISGLLGYALSYQIESQFNLVHLLDFLLGLYFLSSGSLALNQVQEKDLDAKMPRTSKRPVASGKIKPAAAVILAISFIVVGLYKLQLVSDESGYVGLASVILYNGFYTILWKPRWVFAAVPGAIPGALPITIGYAANKSNIFESDSVYLFLIMFLWQMPHFWSLAIKFREDYAKGGVPTLPVSLGHQKTLYHIGLYTFAYVGVAIASPWFVHASWLYLFIVVPFGLKVLREYFRFQSSHEPKAWFPFFMWTNFSMLIFIAVPLIDKWSFLVLPSA